MNTKLSHFDYELDPELVALEPKKERDQSRLLVYHRESQHIEHRIFSALPDYLGPSDLLVFNNTRVFRARLSAVKKTGRKIALLFLHPTIKPDKNDPLTPICWEVLVKGKCTPPVDLLFDDGVLGTITRNLEGGRKEVQLHLPDDRYPDLFSFFEKWGEVPLPPYILKRRNQHALIQDFDPRRYQTVFAEKWGSSAAPTAGLHFTEQLIDQIKSRGTRTATTTLHIGLDTFLPIRTETILEHKMHSEWFQVNAPTAAEVQQTRKKKGRVVAVGTTVTRALESASQLNGYVQALEGKTDLYITPGYSFKGIDAIITNFHLPKSTLLVMLSAFAGDKVIKMIYEEAIRHRYRFFSYGDAMLIL